MESCTCPFVSVKGVLSGMTSSFIASRTVLGTGAGRRSVSRTTKSRYASSFSSSMLGFSVGKLYISSRSLFCISGAIAREYKAHAVALLVVSCPATRNLEAWMSTQT